MIVVVDTNIVFSVIANANSIMSGAFFSVPAKAEYYAPDFLITELQLHKRKLLQLSGLKESEYEISKTSVFAQINFVDVGTLPDEYLKEAAMITRDIDNKDFQFVALAIFLESLLWTGDKVLYKELRRKKFMNVITTSELISTFGL
jgi:predicted nucleic acid-binding protein